MLSSGDADEHGTFATQLAYDIAPGADYYLARIRIPAQFKEAITWFIDQGVDVISTSLGTSWEGPGDGESPYMDAWISQVDRAVEAGIFVAVASGNSDTTSWFGTFRDSDSDNVMEWNDSGDECNELQVTSGVFDIRVRWEDSWNGANDDLDIYLRQKPPAAQDPVSGSNVAMREGAQSGQPGHNPFENILVTQSSRLQGTYCLVIERESGVTPEWVQVIIKAPGDAVRSMEHWVRGYSLGSPAETTSPGAVTVGAAPANNTTTIQSTSGRGPLPASSKRTTVVKPDVVGVDRVPVVDFRGATQNREGTSLATPHVAGLAALAKERYPGFSPALIAAYLKDNALRRGQPASNNPWGYGLAFLPHVGPVITGDPRVGGTLTADTDAVDDIDNLPDSPTFTYQWIRVSSGGSATNISDATMSTYTPVQADAGRHAQGEGVVQRQALQCGGADQPRLAPGRPGSEQGRHGQAHHRGHAPAPGHGDRHGRHLIHPRQRRRERGHLRVPVGAWSDAWYRYPTSPGRRRSGYVLRAADEGSNDGEGEGQLHRQQPTTPKWS